METHDKKFEEGQNRSSQLQKSTSEDLVDILKSERSRLRKALGEMFWNECYRYIYWYKRWLVKNQLDCFFNPYFAKILQDENIINVDDWRPVLTKKFLNSYKHPNWKLHKLKLNLTEEQVIEVIEKYVNELCKSRDQRMSEGSWAKYIRYKWTLYWSEKKWDKESEKLLDEIEWV